ncbi:hypothetical protein ACWF9G_17780 [Nocardia sp. NPDC055029]
MVVGVRAEVAAARQHDGAGAEAADQELDMRPDQAAGDIAQLLAGLRPRA